MKYSTFKVTETHAINRFLADHGKSLANDSVRFHPGSLFRAARVTFFYDPAVSTDGSAWIKEYGKAYLREKTKEIVQEVIGLGVEMARLHKDNKEREAVAKKMDKVMGQLREIQEGQKEWESLQI